MAEADHKNPTWWGEFSIGEGSAGYWKIGPLELRVSRSRREWTIESLRGENPIAESHVVEVPSSKPPLADSAEVSRYGLRATGDKLRVVPVFGDRPLVVNPEKPLSIPAGEEVTLFISVPLWVSLEAGKPTVTLTTMPTHRPSDTWFGPSTLEGELCYASRTRAGLDLDKLPIRAHRARSAVRIRNRSPEILRVENVKLPMPLLTLYVTDGGHFWTNAVTLSREEADEMAALKLSHNAPAEARGARVVSAPRVKPGKNLLIRAFGRLVH